MQPEIDALYARLAAANPDPKGELASVNPFTLLVAVVLSAQATDAGVNRATAALFREADTPAKMLALGEERSRERIKTIGLLTPRPSNVIALSRALVERHGGEVPRRREALEALPGVGRKSANVVLNVGFRPADHRCRYARLPGGQSHRAAPGTHAAGSRDRLVARTPERLAAARPSLADPARPLRVPGAKGRAARTA